MLCHAFENYIEFLQKIHTPDETVSSVFNCHLTNLVGGFKTCRIEDRVCIFPAKSARCDETLQLALFCTFIE